MTDAEPIRSVLYDVQREQGGNFDDFHGWTWTLDLGDVAGEYEAIRTGAAMWDVYALVKWDVTGPDAQAAIQRVFTNDLSNQDVGQVKYGAFLDETGAMVDEGTVYRRGAGDYYVFTNSDDFAERMTSHSPGAAVSAVNRTLEMPLISVQGPRSREILQGLTGTDLSTLGYFRFLPERVEVAGVAALLSRTGFSGELGFELVVDPADAERLWRALAAAGVRPIGFSAVEVARIEAGLIIYEFDYTPGETSPFDVGLDRLVAMEAPVDFVGKPALGALASDPPRRFRTLQIDGTAVPEYGAAVLHGDEVVGTLTSPTASPRCGIIGLAILRSDVAALGTRLHVSVAEGTTPATVAAASIYDPEKRRPRS